MKPLIPTMLAQAGEGWIELIAILALMIGSALIALIQSAKQKRQQRRAQEERAQREHQTAIDRARQARTGQAPANRPAPAQPAQAPPRAPRPGSVEEIVTAMRQAARQRAERARQPARTAPPQRMRPASPTSMGPGQTSDAEIDQRRLQLQANAADVQREVKSLEQQIARQEQLRRQRLGRLESSVAIREGDDAYEAQPVAPVTGVGKLGVRELRRAIIYSEILGKPLAVREQSMSWD